MELADKINAIAKRIEKLRDRPVTEEMTKNATILPLIEALGYDSFDPDQVWPEFDASKGTAKDARVDYALMKNGEPVVLIECKKLGTDLSGSAADQLRGYFNFVQTARIGILTDGESYRCFSDLEESNIMDEAPFLEFKVGSVTDTIGAYLTRLTRDGFDDESALAEAEQLKYSKLLMERLDALFKDPDEEFVKVVCKGVWNTKFTAQALKKLSPLVKDVTRKYLDKRVNDRLMVAVKNEEEEAKEAVPVGPEFNEQEMQGLTIVRAILASDRSFDPSTLSLLAFNDFTAVVVNGKRNHTVVRFKFRDATNLEIDIRGHLKDEPFFHIDDVRNLYHYAEDIRKSYRVTEKLDEAPSNKVAE